MEIRDGACRPGKSGSEEAIPEASRHDYNIASCPVFLPFRQRFPKVCW